MVAATLEQGSYDATYQVGTQALLGQPNCGCEALQDPRLSLQEASPAFACFGSPSKTPSSSWRWDPATQTYPTLTSNRCEVIFFILSISARFGLRFRLTLPFCAARFLHMRFHVFEPIQNFLPRETEPGTSTTTATTAPFL